MSAVLDRLVKRNPLLAHGTRTHSTGIALPTELPAAPARRRTPRDVDAPRVHLGHAGRRA
jgi:hypothetical protein